MPNPFAHVELNTDDVKKAKKFYSAVFAWKLNDLPAMSYTTIDVSGGTGGGMQVKQTPDAPPSWLPYVEVSDVKATIAKVEKAGGKAVLPYQEIGDMGSIGIFVDPQGAMLGVWAPNAAAAAAPAPPAPEKPAAKKAAKKAEAKPTAPAAPAKKAPATKGVKAVPAPAPTKKAPTKKAAASVPAKKAPGKKVPAAPAPAPAKKAPGKKR